MCIYIHNLLIILFHHALGGLFSYFTLNSFSQKDNAERIPSIPLKLRHREADCAKVTHRKSKVVGSIQVKYFKLVSFRLEVPVSLRTKKWLLL